MKTIKVIDLLNKIANGEEVPHFKVCGIEYYLNSKGNLAEREEDKPSCEVRWFIDEEWLNTVVEIIEEDKKIEKIIPTSLKGIDDLDEKIEVAHIDTISAIDKINEIIDKLNEMSDK